MRQRAASLSANASTICCAVQAAVGCSVTLKCSTWRRPCSSTINMFQHDKYEQHLHRERWHGKEVGRDDLPDMGVQESLPGLGRRPAELSQNAGDGTLGDVDAEHFQLAMNPGRAPQRISARHSFDYSAGLCG